MAREKILVVEDEEDILELVEYNLGKQGYRVARASSGEEAIRLTRLDVPDLIVLDLMLPGVDGLDVCRALRRDAATRGIPIVMLTAKGEDSDVVTGLELGADPSPSARRCSSPASARCCGAARRSRWTTEPPLAYTTSRSTPAGTKCSWRGARWS